MREIILLRGAPGSGKSTFIKDQGLLPYTICPDDYRIQAGGIIMTETGKLAISHDAERDVWKQVEEVLNQKMASGAFIIVDATFQRARDFKMFRILARKHRYKVTCIDFSSVPVELAKERNLQRAEHKIVPEEIIDRAYGRYEQNDVPEDVEVIPYTEFENKSVLDHFDVKMVDLNAYKKIHHIGDLQGCYDPVYQYFTDGFKQDEFYIFVGDFLDRGIQNGEVIRWITDEVMSRPNVVLIWGNHETHIHRFALNQRCVSKEFAINTQPQIEKVGFTKDEADRLCDKLVDCFMYEYGDIKCLVSHAGLAKVPENPMLLSSVQYWKGTGSYEHPVDETFSKNMEGTEWIQIHGHRNSGHLPIKASMKSYNLEGEVEHGGHLRIVTIDQQGEFEEIEIRNNTYRPPITVESESEGEEEGKVSTAHLFDLENHREVNVKSFETQPHIRSYNFTRKAFVKGIWDNVTLKARGLFVDVARNIVARSYDKFFNLDESEDMEWEALEKRLEFPVNIYVKENGYLGLLGYDKQRDALFFASKSTPESEFAGWFKEILTAQLGEAGLDSIKRLLRDQNLCMVFEVNDPVRDPHMIEYQEPHVVLLDVLKRTENFEALKYKEAKKIGNKYRLLHKEKALSFDSFEQLVTWHKGIIEQGMEYKWDGEHIEGFVVEDKNGYMFKIKLPFYSYWKYLRGIKERLLTMRQNGTTDLRRNVNDPAVNAFYHWAKQQSDEMLEKDIITIRKIYESREDEEK